MNELLIEDVGHVRVLRMNRPEKRNALNNALTRGLVDALAAAEMDDAVHVVVLTGNGSAFCAGADITEFKDLTPDQMGRVEERAELTMQLHLSVSRMSKPVIAAVNGFAMGGGAGLAIACDLALAARSARFGYPEVKHGIVAAIVLPNLTRQIGRKAAFHMVATGESVDAERAVEMGLANAVHDDDVLMDETMKLASHLAGVSRAAMATTKQTFHQVVDLPLARGLEIGREANKRMRSFVRTER
ncbi:enoyl-CoA hydratase/isomerase family protein [Cupriavidus pauculus]|uniref:enoyl-CoA hydratase/isomerase family protein n=1 Tax=Cupriavidus pauculus TaxID=82633 RepID=UPI001EE20997|nr:enoyl-CoA hydratase/isomerase family protein [Cupriavidus pauculus]GJG97558.1 enoyl-CoA hydratase/isomerase family protein [Cupriavidus pauculus]